MSHVQVVQLLLWLFPNELKNASPRLTLRSLFPKPGGAGGAAAATALFNPGGGPAAAAGMRPGGPRGAALALGKAEMDGSGSSQELKGNEEDNWLLPGKPADNPLNGAPVLKIVSFQVELIVVVAWKIIIKIMTTSNQMTLPAMVELLQDLRHSFQVQHQTCSKCYLSLHYLRRCQRKSTHQCQ